jgi:hypothetical protein
MAPLAAVDNLTLFEVMRTGDPGTKPGPAARAFFHETVEATFRNPTLRNAYLNNAWNLWKPFLSNPREWDGYTDKLATRRTEWGATSIVVDAHGIPTAVQANPNDAQNELRFKKYRPDYRQGTILLGRDEYIPITVDPIQVGRMLAQGFEGEGASRFLAAQLTMVLNTDKAREFNTLMDAWARFVGLTGIYYVHTNDLDPATITGDEAIASAVAIRAAVKNLADFTNAYSPAKAPQTLPASQVRLVISVSAMEALGVGYTGAFNPEYVLALPADQIIEVPDRYFLERPEFAGQQVQWALVDAGEDQGDGGTFVVVDSLYEQAADPFNITGTYNQALHHASFLDLNPFKTMLIGGPGEGSQNVTVLPVPATIELDVYTDLGVIAPGGDLPRGVEFSTAVRVLDSTGNPAGGYEVEIIGATSPTDGTTMLRYNNGKVSNDELSASIQVKATSLLDPAVTVTQTYDLVGSPIDLLSGQTIVNPITFPGVFAAGSGSGGTYTYTPATGVVYERSATEDGARTPLGASPAAVATGVTIWVHATAASGYVFADGTTYKVDGPHTAA